MLETSTLLGGIEVDRSGLEDRVYAALRERIVTRELPPGTILTLRQVSEALQVSPTPVRDAVRRLQTDGLVRDRGRLGAEVVGFTAADVIDLFGARTALETYGARIIALGKTPEALDEMRTIANMFPETFDGNRYTDYEQFAALDAAFHTIIVSAAQNARLTQMYQALKVHLHLARIYQREVEQRAQANHREHLAIVDAIASHQPDDTARAVEIHINNVRDHILTNLSPGRLI